MKNRMSNLACNLSRLRRDKGLTLEEVADRVGATRQAVGKWETGESAPDLAHAAALAEFYGTSLDALVSHDERALGYPVPPKGKHIFGIATVGERGQIVLPKRAREIFRLSPGSRLVVLGNETAGERGIALVESELMLSYAAKIMEHAEEKEE